MRIWRDKHVQWLHRLEDYEGDDMWDYEGWDFHNDADSEEEDLIWLKPIIKKKKGPDPKKTNKDKDKISKPKKK
jgi:hypothetical protein